MLFVVCDRMLACVVFLGVVLVLPVRWSSHGQLFLSAGYRLLGGGQDQSSVNCCRARCCA